MPDHLGLNIHPFELLPVMYQNIMTNKMRQDNHISAVCSDQVPLFCGFDVIHQFVLIFG